VFQRELAVIAAALGPEAVVEQVGDGAVPGLGGVAAVEVMVGVAPGGVAAATQALVEAGYHPVTESGPLQGDRYPGVEVWVVERESPAWRGTLALRDYLRSNPRAAAVYVRARRRAAEEGVTVRGMRERLSPTIAVLAEEAIAWREAQEG
jgi:GrpB-like predicted nucleotidyltransferase (UPF0157 family)